MNFLSEYDEHSQVQLKGFEKDPGKREENLAGYRGWVKDIKTMIEALV